MQKMAVDALTHRYNLEMMNAKTVFNNHYKSSDFTGDHPSLLKDMDASVQKYTEAVEKLRVLSYLAGDLYGIEEEPTLFEGVD